MPSKRELELELALAQSNMQTIQVSVRALNAEGQLLNKQAQEVQGEIARLNAAIKAEEAHDANPPDPSQGAATEPKPEPATA